MKATVLLVTALLVVGAAAPMAVAASTADGPAATESVAVQDGDAANETDNETETAPGAQLAGVVDVQAAEVEGEVERRSFGLQVAAAKSNASKASVVANQTQNLDQRLEDLRERKQELEAARENGNISTGRYRAEMAGLVARISTLQSMTNETAETARSLPEEALAERGVNVSALERLRTSASNLSGPEVAAIARSIAGAPGNNSTGPPFGNGMAGPPVDTPATPGDDENETADNETNPGEGAPDDPGNGPDASGNEDGDDENETATSPGEGDTPGNSSGASGNGPGVNETNETSDEPGPPDDPGNGNGPLIDLSVLTSLLP
ncbi:MULTISPECIES: hypothetical protein [Halobacterium]|uniref:hypothetical protein n=1 Tax=Halobacterium TaxID=2239 RepID=UPI00073E5466|nr:MULTISPECIES: hypothetical protein [Halobacterium]MCG1001966.1 hypothetical protein [Halobacterium noricense]